MKGCDILKELKIFDKNDESIRLLSRPTTDGKELQMVNKYVKYLIKRYQKNKNRSISIFMETKIESGYPDLVVVEYNLDKFNDFYKRKQHLEIQDLKILFECMRLNSCSINDLVELLGFTKKNTEDSIKKLFDYGLICNSNTQKIKVIKLMKQNHIKIIAIEAKIDKWSEALKQASRNTWFATDSYILLNKETCNNNIITECKSRGIGIILVNGKVSKPLKSETKKFPISYGSLLFWEWIVRRGEHKDEI